MDTQKFLEMVWPTQGIYLLAVPRSFTNNEGVTRPYFQHTAFSTAAQAAVWAANNQADDVYFALGSVLADYTRAKADWRKQNGVAIRGVCKESGADNTRALRAFWLDLDVGDAASKYPTQQAAAVALATFCRRANLPKPFVTSSGGGLHVYWPMEHDIDPQTWHAHALRLKAGAAKLGLKADPSRTADRASVLRPVGAWNHKTETPRPVRLMLAGEVSPNDSLLGRLMALEGEHDLVIDVPQARPAAQIGTIPEYLRALIGGDANTLAAAGTGYVEAPAIEVVRACQQLRWQLNNQAQVDEPNWYAMIGALYRAQDGEAAIHRLSCKHPDYSPAHTAMKIEQRKVAATGPTTCATFAALRPAGCDGCPLRGKVSAPINARREREEAQAPTVADPAAGTQALRQLPPPPKPFKRVVLPGIEVVPGQPQPARVAMTVEKEDGRKYDEIIYEYDAFPVEIIYDQREQAYTVVIATWLPKGGWKEHTIPLAVFADARTTAKELASKAIMIDPEHTKHMVKYMSAYVRSLQALHHAKVSYAQCGWHQGDSGWEFILPQAVVRADEILHLDVNRNFKNALEWKDPAGSLDVWREVVALFNRPQMIAHQFGFGVGFAAPLFGFTGFTGAMVSMVGDRGTGKTSAALCANSIFGHTKMGWMDVKKDSWKAFYGKLGTLHNLLATFDEITNLKGDEVSDLAYAVTKGAGRQRLEATGAAAANHGSWSTMLLATSNAGLHNKLAVAKADASAEATRIFEYRVAPNTLPKAEADTAFLRLQENFGVAGPVYAQALVRRREWAKDRVQHWIRLIDQAAGTGSSERFWSAVVATVLTGFEIANEAGLTSADIGALREFGVAQIRRMLDVVSDNTTGPVDILAEYINSSLRTTLVVNSDWNKHQQARIVSPPTGDKITARIESHKGVLYVSRSHWNRYCSEHAADAKDTIRRLVEEGVMPSNKAKKILLGRGTHIQSAQEWCYEITLNNPKLSGMVQAVPDNLDQTA